jgi:hypothetical protein
MEGIENLRVWLLEGEGYYALVFTNTPPRQTRGITYSYYSLPRDRHVVFPSDRIPTNRTKVPDVPKTKAEAQALFAMHRLGVERWLIFQHFYISKRVELL